MNDTKPTTNLPTELIDEKTFYTLGGASAAVLLICWAINYIAVDVSWLTYKTYRLIGVLLSETFAIIIMFQKKDRKAIKWLFALLNGLLIFINASGLNVMTSSYIFNPSDSTKMKTSLYFHLHRPDSESTKHAGIFPLPRMINWWPDEKLLEQNVQLAEKTRTLEFENVQLKTSNESLSARLSSQPKLDSILLLNGSGDNIANKLTALTARLNACLNDKSLAQENLTACMAEKTSLQKNIGTLTTNINEINKKLSGMPKNKPLGNTL